LSARTYWKELGTVFTYELFRAIYVRVSKSTADQQLKHS